MSRNAPPPPEPPTSPGPAAQWSPIKFPISCIEELEPRLALASAGALDTTFSGDGRVTTDIGATDFAYSVALQSDGKIVVGGSAYFDSEEHLTLARYNSNGTLDTSFGGNGKVTAAGPPGYFCDYCGTAVAVQADGKIVIAGYGEDLYLQDNFLLMRYNSDGSLDTTFDGDGKVMTLLGCSDPRYSRAYAMAIQPDGKIVVAGCAEDDSDYYHFAMARYNTDGSLDTTFDGDGKVLTLGSANRGSAYAIGLQSDGKIVLAGEIWNGSDYDIALMRYNSNGSLDTTFDGDGKAVAGIGSGDDRAWGLAIQTDGKIVAAGHTKVGTSSDFALVRYNSDGSLDTTFDGDGKATTDMGGGYDAGRAVALQSDGKIVVAGYGKNGGNDDLAVARYQTDGSLDVTFDGDGKLMTDMSGGYDDRGYAVAIQTDGKIVVGGGANVYNASQHDYEYDFAVARYLGEAVPDATPPSTGTIVITDMGGFTNDPTPTLTLSSDDGDGLGLADMRFALTEDGLGAATWVPYATTYDAFDISAAGPGAKTIWVEYRDGAGNVQSVHTSDTTVYMTPQVLNARNPTVRFRDSDNDWLQVVFSGVGEVWIAGTDGNAPANGVDIGFVGFRNTTAGSVFIVQDLDPTAASANTLTGGVLRTMSGESMGVIRFIAPRGAISNTNISIGANLTMLYALGAVTNVDLTVGGNLIQEVLVGSAANCDLNVTGKATVFQTVGTVTNANITTGGDLLQAIVTGGMTDSTLDIGGTSNVVRIVGNVQGSAITGNDLKYFYGRSLTDSTVTGNASLNIAYCLGDMTNSRFASGGNATLFYVGGNVTRTPGDPVAVQVDGNLTQLIGGKGVTDARFNITGNLLVGQVIGAADNLMLDVDGKATQAIFLGTVTNSTLTVGGRATVVQALGGQTNSTFNLGAGATRVLLYGGVNNTDVTATGDMTNFIATGGINAGSDITINGNLLLASLTGGMAGATLTVNGNARNLICAGPLDGANVRVTGTTSLFQVTQGIKNNSTVALDGQVTQAILYGKPPEASIFAGSTVTLGSLRTILVANGAMEGRLAVTGSAAGSTMKLIGNLKGSLLAGAFGNVTIVGKLDDQTPLDPTIVAEGPGTGTLQITTSGGIGSVNRANAFARYIGYP